MVDSLMHNLVYYIKVKLMLDQIVFYLPITEKNDDHTFYPTSLVLWNKIPSVTQK